MDPKRLRFVRVGDVREPAGARNPLARVVRGRRCVVDGLLTTEDVARVLGCSPAAVRKWRAQGLLRAVKLGRLVRYRGEDVQKAATKGL